MKAQQVNEHTLQGRAVRLAAMVALFAAFAVIEALRCSSLFSLTGADIWWHLSSGLWILDHHALPHTGVFSQSAARSWIAASWLYDVKLAIWYKLLGLRSIPIFLIFFKAALGLVTFLLAGGRRGSFRAAVVISIVAQYILAAVPPTPAYCSVLLLGVELLLLLESRRHLRWIGTGVLDKSGLGVMRWLAAAREPLFWLPPLFLIWANLDIHFVYGLVLLLLFVAAVAVEKFVPSVAMMRPSPGNATQGCAAKPSLASVGSIAALSFLATLITPYFYRPYEVFFSTAFSAANPYLPDYHAPGFRQPQDYALLLFAMAAFLALGLRRSRDPFLIALLAVSAALSFHSERDVWLVVVAAAAVIGEAIADAAHAGDLLQAPFPVEPLVAHGEGLSLAGPTSQNRKEFVNSGAPVREVLIAVAFSFVILIVVVAMAIPRRPEALLARAAQSYPVAASNYIREHRLPQPLFNAFEWGGFLTWYLPEYPVAIDSRTDLYGDDFIIEYSKVMNADVPYTEYSAIADAGTIVLPRSAIMAQALSTLPAFKVAYSDSVAMVLTRESP